MRDVIVLGRDDGIFQIYSMQEDVASAPSIVFETDVEESIRAMAHGEVSAVGYEEIVLCTFSGRIISFSTESLDEKDAEDKYGRNKSQTRREAQLHEAKKEVESLQKQLKKETDKFAKKMYGKAAKDMSADEILGRLPASTAAFDVNHTFMLQQSSSTYLTVVEIASPIDFVVLHSDFQMELTDSLLLASADTEGRVAGDSEVIISMTKTPTDGDQLATIRLAKEAVAHGNGLNRHRILWHTRTTEGQYGRMTLHVIGGNGSSKMASIVNLEVKPLSLHEIIHEAPLDFSSETTATRSDEASSENASGRAISEILLQGSFSEAMAHQWVRLLLPNVPRNPPSQETGRSTLFFQNSSLGTILAVHYGSGRMVLRSDNISTLAIAKDVITKNATSKSIRLQVSTSIHALCAASISIWSTKSSKSNLTSSGELASLRLSEKLRMEKEIPAFPKRVHGLCH